MSESEREQIRAAISSVERSIADHKEGRNAPFSLGVLTQVLAELKGMAAGTLKVPGYPRFLIDWPGGEHLKRILLDIAGRYRR